jgi:hypothetical protein
VVVEIKAAAHQKAVVEIKAAAIKVAAEKNNQANTLQKKRAGLIVGSLCISKLLNSNLRKSA